MINLTPKARLQLEEVQRNRRTKREIYIKVTALLMLDMNIKPADVAKFLGIHESTVFRYQKYFVKYDEDVDHYISNAYRAYSGKLSLLEKEVLCDALDSKLYTTSAGVADFIAQAFEKCYSISGVIKLLHHLGFVYKKTTSVPSKANLQAQQTFMATFVKLLQNLEENEVIYFNDAMHPLHNTRPDCGWIRKGEAWPIPTNSGRKRLNLNGAMNANDPTDMIIQPSDRVNAQSTIKLWEAQRKRHPDKTIYNVADNARYYRCGLIQDFQLENPWCKVIYLPPYSPNLNLIERLWKFLRKKVINLHYYQHFEDFEKAILDFFKNIKQHEKALVSLMQPNFQVLALP